jgi:hypothetical protein
MRTMRFLILKKLIEIMQIRGVKVFVHWSVLLIGAIILLGAVEDAPLAFTVLGSYYGVILLHECGHMVAAQRKGCAVRSIELYPVWGITCFRDLILGVTTALSLGVVSWRRRLLPCRRLFGSKCSATRGFRR